jgi:16S rRNA (uracil1498-N3)-methyltransferase
MRKSAGDRVLLFDGRGREYTAMIEATGRHTVLLAVEEERVVDREASANVTMLVAPPKGERQKWLVEKLTELGCRRLVPMETRRSVARPSEKVIARWRRQVVEASKQCGRTRLMEIGPPMDFSDAMAMAGEAAAWRGIAHPDSAATKPPLLSVQLADKKIPDEVILAIGPEGGFTDREIALAEDAGWKTTSLGERILRIETAAFFAMASILAISETRQC